MMSDCPLVGIVMGVAEVGKRVVARLLSDRFDSDFPEFESPTFLTEHYQDALTASSDRRSSSPVAIENRE